MLKEVREEKREKRKDPSADSVSLRRKKKLNLLFLCASLSFHPKKTNQIKKKASGFDAHLKVLEKEIASIKAATEGEQ